MMAFRYRGVKPLLSARDCVGHGHADSVETLGARKLLDQGPELFGAQKSRLE
jgi:hypothetical protein